MRPLLSAICLALGLIAMGCGSDSSDQSAETGEDEVAENEGVALTRWLPPGDSSYLAMDLGDLREEMGVEPDADIISAPDPDEPLAGLAIGGIFSPFSDVLIDQEVLEALELGAAQAAASSSDVGMSVIATDADADEVQSNLEAMGFKAEDETLVRAGEPSGFVVRDGLILAAPDATVLDELPSAPAEEVPDTLLEPASGFYVNVLVSDPGQCVEAQATVLGRDGQGELRFRFAEDLKLSEQTVTAKDVDGVDFGTPVVDGDTITVGATGRPDSAAIPEAVSKYLPVTNEFALDDC